MATLSQKKIASIQAQLNEHLPSDTVKFVMDVISEHANVKAHNEKCRETQKRYSDRVKEKNGTTYTASDKEYYEKNKDRINARHTEVQRAKRVQQAT